MRVEQIELLLINLPYVHYFETSFGREEERLFILVKVLAEGITGYGEVVADKSPLYSYETTDTAWHILEGFLIPRIFKSSIVRPQEFYEQAGMYKGHPMAKAGLELALWDFEAKKKGLPLWKLYGGVRKEVPSGVSVGIQDSLSQLVDRIQSFLDQGYQRIKIKIKPEWDIDICREVRKRFPDTPLQVDANGAYSLQDKERLKKLDAFNLLMIEQPFPAHDLWDHSGLQREMKTPLCLDESIINVDSARKAMEMGSCRVINIKPGRVGGIMESRKIHDLCQKNSLPVWCGGMLESGIGRAHNIHLATLPNFQYPNDLSASKRYYAQDLIDPPIDITPQGTIKVPELPGIGVAPQEDRVKRSTLRQVAFKRSDF